MADSCDILSWSDVLGLSSGFAITWSMVAGAPLSGVSSRSRTEASCDGDMPSFRTVSR